MFIKHKRQSRKTGLLESSTCKMELIKLIDEIVVKYNAWGTIEQTRGGIGPEFLHCKSYKTH